MKSQQKTGLENNNNYRVPYNSTLSLRETISNIFLNTLFWAQNKQFSIIPIPAEIVKNRARKRQYQFSLCPLGFIKNTAERERPFVILVSALSSCMMKYARINF